MRNAFGFLPSRYECGYVPFPPPPLFFSLDDGELLKGLKLLVYHGKGSSSQLTPKTAQCHARSTRSRRQIKA